MFPGEVLGGMYWAPANKLYVRTPHTTTYSYVHASSSGSEVIATPISKPLLNVTYNRYSCAITVGS